jgi:hypothetical protein
MQRQRRTGGTRRADGRKPSLNLGCVLGYSDRLHRTRAGFDFLAVHQTMKVNAKQIAHADSQSAPTGGRNPDLRQHEP